jgi:hypothetical protein
VAAVVTKVFLDPFVSQVLSNSSGSAAGSDRGEKKNSSSSSSFSDTADELDVLQNRFADLPTISQLAAVQALLNGLGADQRQALLFGNAPASSMSCTLLSASSTAASAASSSSSSSSVQLSDVSCRPIVTGVVVPALIHLFNASTDSDQHVRLSALETLKVALKCAGGDLAAAAAAASTSTSTSAVSVCDCWSDVSATADTCVETVWRCGEDAFTKVAAQSRHVLAALLEYHSAASFLAPDAPNTAATQTAPQRPPTAAQASSRAQAFLQGLSRQVIHDGGQNSKCRLNSLSSLVPCVGASQVLLSQL